MAFLKTLAGYLVGLFIFLSLYGWSNLPRNCPLEVGDYVLNLETNEKGQVIDIEGAGFWGLGCYAVIDYGTELREHRPRAFMFQKIEEEEDDS